MPIGGSNDSPIQIATVDLARAAYSITFRAAPAPRQGLLYFQLGRVEAKRLSCLVDATAADRPLLESIVDACADSIHVVRTGSTAYNRDVEVFELYGLV